MIGENMYLDNCPKCKMMEKKRQSLSSRLSSLNWAIDDYDRVKGKGAFKKKYPDSVKHRDSLLERKTKIIVDHAMHEPMDEEKKDELQAEQPSTAPVI